MGALVRKLDQLLPKPMTTEETLEMVVRQRDEWRLACYVIVGTFALLLLLASRR
jgi:hypothetical protein